MIRRYLCIAVLLLVSSYPSNIPRFWNDTYAENSQGYCEYQNGFGWNGSLQWPADNHSVRTNRHFSENHKGIDIDLEEGSNVYAAQSGTIIWNGYSQFGGGYIVIIAHGNGYRTIYAHLNESFVECGDNVLQGEIIALSGKTGTSFYHLHFAVDRYDSTFDPMLYLP